LSSSYEHESAPDLVRRIRQSARHQERAGRLLGGTHVAHRSQCVELRHVGSRRRQSAAAARRQAVDDGSTAIPTWMRSAPPQALRAPCSWVLSGALYTVWSHARQAQVVWPPPWP